MEGRQHVRWMMDAQHFEEIPHPLSETTRPDLDTSLILYIFKYFLLRRFPSSTKSGYPSGEIFCTLFILHYV